MTQIGMPQSRIDEIELRLVGADFRPWKLERGVRDENGRALVCKASKNQHAKAAWSSLSNDPKPNLFAYASSLSLFKLCGDATEDMGEFVAHAPDDIADLVEEVKRLRSRLRSAEQERDEMKKEMLSARVERSAYAEKLQNLRSALRSFKKEMDAC